MATSKQEKVEQRVEVFETAVVSPRVYLLDPRIARWVQYKIMIRLMLDFSSIYTIDNVRIDVANANLKTGYFATFELTPHPSVVQEGLVASKRLAYFDFVAELKWVTIDQEAGS